MADTEFFTIGHIVAPHGVRGDVRIYPDTDFPERFLEMKYAYIDGVKYAVKEARFHKRVVLVKFDGIDDRNGAAALVKKEIQIPRTELMPLAEGQYYIFDIIGCSVFDKNGNLLGEVTDILRTGSNDVYVVTGEDGNEVLLAVIPDVILSVDVRAKKIIADPPEWI